MTVIRTAAFRQDPLSPSVDYLVSVLTERISQGTYLQGQRLPSERALCAEFSVSRPTVRQVIEELENRSLIRRLAGHRPVVWNTINGTEPPSLRRRSIALWITGNPRDLGPVAMTRSVHLALSADAFRLVVACPQGATEEEVLESERVGLGRLAEDEDIAGVILWYLGGETNRPALTRLQEQGKFLVFVDRQPPAGLDADFVGVYNEFGAAEAVRYLIGLGHRHIAHITNAAQISSVRERLSGYQKALTEAGIAFCEDYLIESDLFVNNPLQKQQFWRDNMERLRRLPGPPTAVFAVNDYSAMQLIAAAREAGARIPEDLSVVGFDDSERWSAHAPFLTSVAQPFEAMGVEAVRILEQRLSGQTQGAFRHILLPASLQIRSSTAPPPTL